MRKSSKKYLYYLSSELSPGIYILPVFIHYWISFQISGINFHIRFHKMYLDQLLKSNSTRQYGDICIVELKKILLLREILSSVFSPLVQKTHSIKEIVCLTLFIFLVNLHGGLLAWFSLFLSKFIK